MNININDRAIYEFIKIIFMNSNRYTKNKHPNNNNH